MAAAVKSRDWRKRKPSSHTSEVRHTREALPAETVARIEALEAAVLQLEQSVIAAADANASLLLQYTDLKKVCADLDERITKTIENGVDLSLLRGAAA